jgi:hypothetical protein
VAQLQKQGPHGPMNCSRYSFLMQTNKIPILWRKVLSANSCIQNSKRRTPSRGMGSGAQQLGTRFGPQPSDCCNFARRRSRRLSPALISTDRYVPFLIEAASQHTHLLTALAQKQQPQRCRHSWCSYSPSAKPPPSR